MPLMEFAEFDRRPIIVAIAGPNGAGKTALASPGPISRRSVWRCAFLRAVMMFPTTRYSRGFLERSPISRPPSRGYLMY